MTLGKLRIFLGAAPGVGKTFTMLEEGKRLAVEGADVVVGVVETHGRQATAAMADGIEMVPTLPVTYRGLTTQELDVGAVIARRPDVVLVDELAHSNAPGLANAKRWQDVRDILAEGISVMSTVNVQHIESLNDVVEKITGVPQRETVPDEALRMAIRSRWSTSRPTRCGGDSLRATSTRPSALMPRCRTISGWAI